MPRVLSEGEHEYLKGQKEVKEGSPKDRTIRNRIRDHIKEAVAEFRTVQDSLGDRDRKLIHDEIEATTATECKAREMTDSEPTLERGPVAMVSFVYGCCQNSELEFETVLERAVGEQRPYDEDVLVEFEVNELDDIDLEEAARKYFLGDEQSSREEIEALAKHLTRKNAEDSGISIG